jgi:hypothetical protein
MLKKKIWANFQKIIELFSQKNGTKLTKILVWDPGSENRDPEKTYSGSRIQGSKKAPDPGSGSATLMNPSILTTSTLSDNNTAIWSRKPERKVPLTQRTVSKSSLKQENFLGLLVRWKFLEFFQKIQKI